MRQQEQIVRFKDAPWLPKNSESVLIGGAGGIGSWLALLLARANFQVHLFDDDTVEEINMAGQFFSKRDIGKTKVGATFDNVSLFSGLPICTYSQRITEETSMFSTYSFSAFDNMTARRNLFNLWKKSINGLNHPIFIDGRLDFETLHIFCVTPENMDLYESEHLFDDSLIATESCTLRQTTHTATLIASYMTAFFTNHIANVYQEEKIRDVPFFTEIFLPMNLTITTNG